jgi:hypothetical protein
MSLRELQKLLQSGDKRLYQKTIKKLIKRISERYSKLEGMLIYLTRFEKTPGPGSFKQLPDIAQEKRPKGQQQSRPEAPTVGALRAQGLLYILN